MNAVPNEALRLGPHDVGVEGVRGCSPSLVDKRALSTDELGIAEIADQNALAVLGAIAEATGKRPSHV